MKEIKSKTFKNGAVYLLHTNDGLPIEVTDTFLPYYTKDAIGEHQNILKDRNVGSRLERWMIGLSVSSGCPVNCLFCATGNLKTNRNLTWEEIVEQVYFIFDKQDYPSVLKSGTKELKLNYTRMGDTFLNIENVKKAISYIDLKVNPFRKLIGKKDLVHHFISTIGIKGSDFSWIKDNITLQFSVHSFDEKYRDLLIPYKYKMSLEEMGQVRTKSNLKTTINLTLTRPEDFDINKLKKYFDPEYFFIKLSPLNTSDITIKNNINGIIKQKNLL